MDGRRDRDGEVPVVLGVAIGYCPACGPVGGTETSRYCARHIAELRARWRAMCALRSATTRAA
jgi:hypothetical protein